MLFWDLVILPLNTEKCDWNQAKLSHFQVEFSKQEELTTKIELIMEKIKNNCT